MIYCLLGESASGKSTIEKKLEQYGLIRIISSTTRPMREKEQEGVDYYYISEDEFKINLNRYYEHTQYRDWHYCIDPVKNNIDLHNNYVCVIEPNGYKSLIEKVGRENVKGIYVKSNDKDRLLRSLNREVKPDCKEICRRFISDLDLFKDIKDIVDYTIENNDINASVNMILKLIGIQPKKLMIMDKVRVIGINSSRADHLKVFIGKIGYIFSYIIKDETRYKVIFDVDTEDEQTAYFRRSELELVNQ